MAEPNIVYLPGIFGSEIGFPAPYPLNSLKVWLTPATALTGQLLQLQLAADGVSPGPLTFGVSWQATDTWAPSYGPMAAWMKGRGWQVLEAFYDWRLSVLQSGAAVLASIQAAFGSQPIVFVAHSMGGLVARAVYGLMLSQGMGQQVLGMVTMGTPHFGSWAIQRGFFGLDPFYAVMQFAAGLVGPYVPGYRVDFLDVILASWPGWYELAPWRDSGPLAISDPATARALYQAATYQGGNPYVVQNRFDQAAITQNFLAPAIPLGKLVCIRGKGYITAYEVNSLAGLAQLSGYKYTGGGDGVVPLDNATALTGVNVDLVVEHGKMPLEYRVWNAVLWAVQTLVGPGA